MKELSLSEIIVLLAIWRLDDNAYGVKIRKQIASISQRFYSYGTLYSSLDQLYRKGFVEKKIGGSTKERGGRSKVFYLLTSEGMRALGSAQRLQQTLWEDVPDEAFDKF